MKKLLLFLTSLLLVTGCNNSNLNPQVANSKWGVEAAQACLDTVGTVIPYMECDAFEYNTVIDDYGDPAIWFYLYYETQEIAEQKVIDYAYIAYEQGKYTCEVKLQRFVDYDTYSYWEQDVLFADKNLSKTNAIEIQGLASIKEYDGKSMGCLGLFCFNYIPNIDPTSFPTYPVSTIAGENVVPALTGENLEFDFSFYMYNDSKCIEIVVDGDGSSYLLEEDYFYCLLENGYFIMQYDDLLEDYTEEVFYLTDEYPDFQDELCYYALDPEGKVIVYFDYDLYAGYFYIDIFPFALINS